VEQDAVDLVNDMLNVLDALYPGATHLEKVTLIKTESHVKGSESAKNSSPEPTNNGEGG